MIIKLDTLQNCKNSNVTSFSSAETISVNLTAIMALGPFKMANWTFEKYRTLYFLGGELPVTDTTYNREVLKDWW